ncbi:flagellar hook-associated protein 2 [Peribacillus frigoritolerans]|uniref:flagellar hook-associated protein 2 n=1 Tax=Peribacillus frigoritolerans TaxID=450367 RepID=UPI00209E4F0E|nr:flagellar hook-associated protein 2 [Peribacillus frigoritolerans]MCP1155680.1 flagellar hook-associated protein 2 [Peribacillus frigoritolerans]MCT1391645.1 flagellar hook-associated protein 2 [Peribacillus frigoritolerans]
MVRISGLASGMDIDELVKSMMQAERVPLDKLTQKKQYSEWQRDDYRSMNTALSELDTLIRDGIGKQSSFIKKKVTVSNPDAVSVKNVNSTSDFSGNIKVNGLAKAATMTSTEKSAVTDPKKKLSELGITTPQDITILTINKDGGFDTEVKDGATVEKPYTLTLNADDTLESVINKINAISGVTLFFDETYQKFSITAKNTGDAKDRPEIELGGTGDFFNVLKMSSNNEGAGGSKGENASIVYNGLEISRPSNTFQINGAEITVKQKTTDTVTFSSTADVDAILDTITQFVNKYNEAIKKVQDKTGEAKYRSFTPLTSEQKKAMTEDEVKLWEEKAKSGTLKSDSTLKSLLTTMRSSLYTSVDGIAGKNNLSSLGITTTKNYLEGGKLTIDEDKLRAAISEDPNAIYDMFMANGAEKSDKGLARRLRDDIESSMKAITEKAGKAGYVNNNFTIGKLVDGLDKKISTFEAKLTILESRYYNQFTAMEKAIQKANSQSASLASYFS